jgi:hypothetical protein
MLLLFEVWFVRQTDCSLFIDYDGLSREHVGWVLKWTELIPLNNIADNNNSNNDRVNNTTTPSPIQTNSARCTHSQVRESCRWNVLLLARAQKRTTVVCWLLCTQSWPQNIWYLLTNCQLLPRVNCARERQCTNDHLDELGVEGKIT